MKKEYRATLVEFVSRLSEDDLLFLESRLVNRLPGDLGEALEYLGRKPEVDDILVTALTSWELYDYLDALRDIVLREAKRRNVQSF